MRRRSPTEQMFVEHHELTLLLVTVDDADAFEAMEPEGAVTFLVEFQRAVVGVVESSGRGGIRVGNAVLAVWNESPPDMRSVADRLMAALHETVPSSSSVHMAVGRGGCLCTVDRGELTHVKGAVVDRLTEISALAPGTLVVDSSMVAAFEPFDLVEVGDGAYRLG